MTIQQLVKKPQGYFALDAHRNKINEVIQALSAGETLPEGWSIEEPLVGEGSGDGSLALYLTKEGVREFVGEVGGGYTDQLVFTKALGGLRFKNNNQDTFEYFVARRELSGDSLGTAFGNFDTNTGNYLATSEVGGLTAVQLTDVDISQQLGNTGSTNYIESTLFSFQITSDQVRPYGIQTRKLTGETDVDFIDIPFDTRIYDSTGTVVYSNIQNTELWRIQPQPAGDPRFTLSSSGGVVVLPMSQPFPMDSADTYTVEYEFATAIRLKGDGAQPALLLEGKQLEYYPINYTSEVFIKSSDFIALSGAKYKVDASGGPITVTVHPTVKSFTIGDYANTFTDTNTITLSTPYGSAVLDRSGRRTDFTVIVDGNTYRVYETDGTLETIIP